MPKIVRNAELLSPEEFKAEAQMPLNQLFQTTEFHTAGIVTRPFSEGVSDRLILEIDSFTMDAGQYRAIRETARSVGDDHFLYSVFRAYTDRSGPSFRLPLVGYEEYYTVHEHIPREFIGIPLDNALYSRHGIWGVCCQDGFAVLGGSPAFIARFKEEFPHWQAELVLFLDGMRVAVERNNADASWVQPLLDHVYGAAAPQRWLAVG